MKTIRCVQPNQFSFEERAYPSSKEGNSIIAIKRIGICGTDLHAYKGNQPFFSYPRVLGHELAGEFVEGDAPGFSKGDLLTVLPYKSCGTCFACMRGKTNCCASLSVLGVHEDGGMSEYISVPNHLLIPSGGLTLDQLALVEPLAIGAHAVRRAMIQEGDSVVVIGAGPIGNGLLHFLKLLDIKLMVAETNEFRLNFCKTHFPTVDCIDASKNDLVSCLRDFTHGNMPSIVFDATGNLATINESFRYLSHAGTYILVGFQQGALSVAHPEFHKREATLMSSRNATYNDFHFVMQAMHAKTVQAENMITHRLHFNDVVNDFPRLYEASNSLLKAMISL
jgi:hypothetical protein